MRCHVIDVLVGGCIVLNNYNYSNVTSYGPMVVLLHIFRSVYPVVSRRRELGRGGDELWVCVGVGVSMCVCLCVVDQRNEEAH